MRMLMAHAGIEFEDVRISMEAWPEYKPKMPGGVVPVLEFPNGHMQGQSNTILRFLGQKHGYYPKDPV